MKIDNNELACSKCFNNTFKVTNIYAFLDKNNLSKKTYVYSILECTKCGTKIKEKIKKDDSYV